MTRQTAKATTAVRRHAGSHSATFRTDRLLADQGSSNPVLGRTVIAASALFHGALVVVLVVLFAIVPEAPPVEPVAVVFYSPADVSRVEPVPPPVPPETETIEPEPVEAPVEPAVSEPVKAPLPPPPRETAKRARQDPPSAPRPTTVVEAPEPVKPPPQSRQRVVKTAVFAAPESTDAPRRTENHARGTAKVGGFQTSAPAAPRPRAVHEQQVVVAAAFAGEPAGPADRNRNTREPRAVTNAGFGGTESAAPAAAGDGPTPAVRQGGFGDDVVAAVPHAPQRAPQPSPDTPVEILSKPRPEYTDEARELKIEGEVVLEVIFPASGALQVVGVVSGLGHGLDEAAVEAARRIKFTPALRSGRPIDHKARLRILFQLA